MVYQFNGKYGPFTIKSEKQLDVLAFLFRLANDNSVYLKYPSLIDESLDYIQFNIEIQKHFPDNINAYVDDNLQQLIAIINDVLPGYSNDRIEYEKSVSEIQESQDNTEENEELIKMLKESYFEHYEISDKLLIRIRQIKAALEFRKSQLLDLFENEKIEIENSIETDEDSTI